MTRHCQRPVEHPPPASLRRCLAVAVVAVVVTAVATVLGALSSAAGG